MLHAQELAAHSAPRRLRSERARWWPSERVRQWTSECTRWNHSALPPRAWELHLLQVLMLPGHRLWLLLSCLGRWLLLLLLLWPALLRLVV